MRSRTITRNMLSGVVAAKCSVSKKDANTIINETFNQIITEVRIGNRVRLNNFGVFYSAWRKAKVGNDITRHTRIDIPSCKAPIFKASFEFKRKLK